MSKISGALILMIILTAAYSSAETYYVSTIGNDNNPGSLESPWRTVSRAADIMVAGDTVYIREGTYNEMVSPRNSGTADEYITYAPYPGETVTIDGTGISVGHIEGLINLQNVDYIIIQGLRVVHSHGDNMAMGICSHNSDHIIIKDCYTYDTQSCGIGVYGGNHIIIDNNEIERACVEGSEEQLSVADGAGYVVISNNEVHHGYPSPRGGEGINIKYGAHHVNVSGNYAHDFQKLAFGVDAWTAHTYEIRFFNNVAARTKYGFILESEQGGLAENLYVYNNIAYDIDEAAYSLPEWGIAGPVDKAYYINNIAYSSRYGFWGKHPNIKNIVIRNNIFSQNSNNPQIRLYPDTQQHFTIDHNLFYGNTAGPLGLNHIIGNPLFIDAAAHDFRLQSDSPAIDGGSAEQAPSADFDGNPRPQGSGYDIGAFEHGSVRECYESDWTYSDGPCQTDNTRLRTWTKTGSCTGGVFHTASETLSCIYTPTCTEEDWESSDGPCTAENTLLRTWIKTGSCEGGVSHPSTETLSCQSSSSQCTEEDWTYSDGACRTDNTLLRTWTKTGSCTGGVLHPASETISCNYIADLSFSATDGILTSPMQDYGSYIATSTGGGSAVYEFTISTPGDYIIVAMVDAQDTGSNSFLVNIDSLPSEPQHVWDIDVTDGFEQRTISWRGSGTFDNNEFVPKVFSLASGQHRLYVNGRESNTRIQSIAFSLLDPDSGHIFGDMNLDGKVDLVDILTIIINFGPATDKTHMDLKANNKIDFFDMVMVARNIGKTCREDWSCTSWSDCNDGVETRDCTDKNSCGTMADAPQTSRFCEDPSLDRFGIMMIYPSLIGGRIFYSEWGNGIQRTIGNSERDPYTPDFIGRGNGQTIIDGAGVATMSGNSPRMYIYDSGKEDDWDNVEITLYFMRVSETQTVSYQGFAGSAKSEHQDANDSEPCYARTYYGKIFYDGRAGFIKELAEHALYTYYEPYGLRIDWNTPDGSVPRNQWIGMKFVARRTSPGVVDLELYKDMTDGADGGTWELVASYTDHGQWTNVDDPEYDLEAVCGYDASIVFDDPGTSVFVRNDYVQEAKVKKFSVREI